jgi:import inner membrane translocase subunit TIM50
LIQLIPFLEYVATMGFDDAREVLKSFEGTYIPAEFARREKILREKFEKQEAEKRKGKPKKSVGGLGSLLGLSKPQEDQSLGEGKMLWDQIRERGQQQYMEFDKKIKEEGEKWLAERDAEEKRMQEEAMKSMKPGAWFSGFLGGGNKPAEEKK